jgi:hypothetical protein
LGDKNFSQPVTSLSGVLTTFSQVNAEQLTAALYVRMGDAKVASIEVLRATVNHESFDVR